FGATGKVCARTGNFRAQSNRSPDEIFGIEDPEVMSAFPSKAATNNANLFLYCCHRWALCSRGPHFPAYSHPVFLNWTLVTIYSCNNSNCFYMKSVRLGY